MSTTQVFHHLHIFGSVISSLNGFTWNLSREKYPGVQQFDRLLNVRGDSTSFRLLEVSWRFRVASDPLHLKWSRFVLGWIFNLL